MQYRSDIIRGIRLAAAGLAILLLVVLAKRTIKVEATGAPVAQVAEAPAAVTPAPPPAPAVVPDPPGGAVPAAPPKQGVLNRAAAKRVSSRPASPSPVQLPEATETLSAPPPPEQPVETRASIEASPVSADPEPAPAAEPAETTTVAPPAPESRGKRILKAVGRFFRGGKKDDVPPAESGKPKQ